MNQSTIIKIMATFMLTFSVSRANSITNENLNIMGLNKIDSQVTWGRATESLNANFNHISSDMEKMKNASFRNKGYFLTEADMKAAYPIANVGDKAYVGTSESFAIWVYETNGWKNSGKTGGDESVDLEQYYTKTEVDEIVLTPAKDAAAYAEVAATQATNAATSASESAQSAEDAANSAEASKAASEASAKSALAAEEKSKEAAISAFNAKNFSISNRYGYNVTIHGLKGGIHTLASAVKDIPAKHRMLGQKITFRTENGDWATYHNESLSLDNYENVNDWVQEVGISSVQGDVNITNAPDYEDLTEASDGTIKFADKEYNVESFSGLGRVYLRKNIVDGVNVLTQDMVSKSNTIYIIQYDYDLQGAEITIPEGCVLEFKGGSISGNGTGKDTIIGANTSIQAGLVKIFNTNVILAGTWNVKEYFPEWFGATSGTTDNDAVVNVAAIQYCFNNFSKIKLSSIYRINESIIIKKERIYCSGLSSSYSGLRMTANNKPIFNVIHNGSTFPGIQGTKFADMSLDYLTTQLGSANNRSYTFLYESETPSTGQHGWGWYNSTFKDIRTRNNYGFIKTTTEPFWGNHIENIICYDLGGNFIDNLNTVGGTALNNVYSVKILNQAATANKDYTNVFDLTGEWNIIGVEIEGFRANSLFRNNGGYMNVTAVHAEANYIKYVAFIAGGVYNFKQILINNCNFVYDSQNIASIIQVNSNGGIQVNISNFIIDHYTKQKLISDNITIRMFKPGDTEAATYGLQRFRWTGENPVGEHITLLPPYYYNPWAQDIYINGMRQGMSGDGTTNKTYPTTPIVGEMFLLNSKPIWWNGSAWVDATGAPV